MPYFKDNPSLYFDSLFDLGVIALSFLLESAIVPVGIFQMKWHLIQPPCA